MPYVVCELIAGQVAFLVHFQVFANQVPQAGDTLIEIEREIERKTLALVAAALLRPDTCSPGAGVQALSSMSFRCCNRRA
jgi:hypothetical protein